MKILNEKEIKYIAKTLSLSEIYVKDLFRMGLASRKMIKKLEFYRRNDSNDNVSPEGSN